MSFDPTLIGTAIYVLLAGGLAFVDFSALGGGEHDDASGEPASWPGQTGVLDVFGGEAGDDADIAPYYNLLRSEEPDICYSSTLGRAASEADDLPAEGQDAATADMTRSATVAVESGGGTPPLIRDFIGDRDTLVVEFPAETDPGELDVVLSEDGQTSQVLLGGVVVAVLATKVRIDPGAIVLKGV